MLSFGDVNKSNGVILVFYNNFVNLCNKAGKSPSAIAEEMGYQRSVVTRWSKGTAPRQATLQKVADYFGISVDDLISDEKEKDSAPVSAEPFIGASYLTAEEKQKVNEYIALLLAARQKQ